MYNNIFLVTKESITLLLDEKSDTYAYAVPGRNLIELLGSLG